MKRENGKKIEYKSPIYNDIERIIGTDSLASNDMDRIIENNAVKNCDLKIMLDIIKRKEKIKNGYDESSLDSSLFKDGKISVSELPSENREQLTSIINVLCSEKKNIAYNSILNEFSMFSLKNGYSSIIERGYFVFDEKILSNVINFSCSCVLDSDLVEWVKYVRQIQYGNEIKHPVKFLEESNFSSYNSEEEKEIKFNSDVFKKNNTVKYPLLVSLLNSALSIGTNSLIKYGCYSVIGIGGVLVLKSLLKTDLFINIFNNDNETYHVGKTDVYSAAKVLVKCFINYLIKECKDD